MHLTPLAIALLAVAVVIATAQLRGGASGWGSRG